MRIIKTDLPDVLLIEPDIHGDERGFFLETYQLQRYSEAGINVQFVQDNLSGSRQGTLRGLHFQIRQPQGKLVWVSSGLIFDVVVDLRRHSPAFGKWTGVMLTSKEKRQVWVPPGFAHGVYVLSDWAELNYKATDFYAPQWERTLLWNDPSLGIPWPLRDASLPELSKKDANGLSLQELVDRDEVFP